MKVNEGGKHSEREGGYRVHVSVGRHRRATRQGARCVHLYPLSAQAQLDQGTAKGTRCRDVA